MVVVNFQNIGLKMSDFSALLFIAIKRQWSLECILKLEGFAKTKGLLLCRDLQNINLTFEYNHLIKLELKKF